MENIYIIRKIVKAKNIVEALKKEKKAPIGDIVLASVKQKEQLLPAIGFSPTYSDGEENTEYAPVI